MNDTTSKKVPMSYMKFTVTMTRRIPYNSKSSMNRSQCRYADIVHFLDLKDTPCKYLKRVVISNKIINAYYRNPRIVVFVSRSVIDIYNLYEF